MNLFVKNHKTHPGTITLRRIYASFRPKCEISRGLKTGKHYPNVWLNMAWMYIISISAGRQIISEWIDLVLRYRILGFGSGVHFPEMIYGHLQIAWSCVVDVLTAKVNSDFLSEQEALSLARKMFRDKVYN